MNTFIRTADRLGMAGAALCGLHCIALPVLIMASPLLTWLDVGEDLHQYLAILAIVPVLAGLVPGYLIHRRKAVIVFGVAGLLCLSSAVWLVGPFYGEFAESVITAAGAALLFSAHLKNRKLLTMSPA